jgi:hypothetical protein
MSSRVRASRSLLASFLARTTQCARRGTGGAIACLALAATMTACASQAPVSLPPKGHSPASAAELNDAGQSAREQVLTAYTGYWQASTAAIGAGNPAAARALLAPYLTADAITGVLAALRPDWAQHAVAVGSPVSHILSVKITGPKALVHDCADLSHAGLANARTKKAYPRSFGSTHANFYADLVLSPSGWLVSNLVPVVAPCEP